MKELEKIVLGVTPTLTNSSDNDSGKADPEAQILEVAPNLVDAPPDGGLEGWLTVLGAWFILFSTYGYIYAFGVYQDFYTRVFLKNKTPSQISWIGSLQYAMPFLIGLFSGSLFDHGRFHILEISGGILFIASLFMLSLAKESQYYQFFLAQGVGMGIGLGLLFVPTLAVINHHFLRRRGLAGGVAFSGTAVGGIIFPIMLNHLIQRVSFGEAVRASGYLVLGCMIIGNLLMRTRYPKGANPPPPILSFFKEPSYLYVIAGGIWACFGLIFPVVYMQLYAIEHGLDPNLAFYSIAIINAASAVGRVGGNFLADIVGPFTVITPTVFGLSLSIWLMLAIKNSASLIIVCIIHGMFSGAYFALVVLSLASLAKEPSHIGSKVGVALAIASFAFLGSTPSHGALLTPTFKWIRPVAFAGVFTGVAAVLHIFILLRIRREKGSKRV